MQQEVGSGMLPTHAIMMTTYSPQHILHNTCIMDAEAEKKHKHEGRRQLLLCLCWCWWSWKKQTNKKHKKQISHLTKICTQLFITALNAPSLYLSLSFSFSHVHTRAHVPHATGRAHANLLANATAQAQEPLTVAVPACVIAACRSVGCLRRGHLPPPVTAPNHAGTIQIISTFHLQLFLFFFFLTTCVGFFFCCMHLFQDSIVWQKPCRERRLTSNLELMARLFLTGLESCAAQGSMGANFKSFL